MSIKTHKTEKKNVQLSIGEQNTNAFPVMPDGQVHMGT